MLFKGILGYLATATIMKFTHLVPPTHQIKFVHRTQLNQAGHFPCVILLCWGNHFCPTCFFFFFNEKIYFYLFSFIFILPPIFSIYIYFDLFTFNSFFQVFLLFYYFKFYFKSTFLYVIAINANV